MKTRRSQFIFALTVCVLGSLAVVWARPASMELGPSTVDVAFQGRFVDNSGVPLTGTHDLFFQIFDETGTMRYNPLTPVSVDLSINGVATTQIPAVPIDVFDGFPITGAPYQLKVSVDDVMFTSPFTVDLQPTPFAVQALDLFPNVVGSLDGVTNDLGDIDLVEGLNITITPDDFNDSITISATGGDGHSLDAADGDPTDAVFVDNEGRVGIGTTTPNKSAQLTVVGPISSFIAIGAGFGDNRLHLRGALSKDTGVDFFQGGQPKWFVGMVDFLGDDSLNVHVQPGLANAVTIVRPSGFVGLETTNPSQRLHVVGNICATGSIGPCSDARFKENIGRIPDPLPKLLKLRGVHFDWKRDEFPDWKFSDQRQVGLIAQEVLAVLPEVVSKGTDGFYSVDYGRVVPVLVEAIKELHATVEDRDIQIAVQVQRIDDLSARLDRMETMLAEVAERGEH